MADDDFFALPAFKPAEALVALKRGLRELKGWQERQAGFDFKGNPVLMLQAGETAIEARLAKRPGRAPEWETRRLGSSPDVRKFLEEARRRHAAWQDED